MNCSTPGLPVHHQPPESTQTHIHWIGDAIQPSHSILCTYRPGELIFQCPIFLPFHTVHVVLKARILKWLAIFFSSGPHSVRPLHHDPSVLGGHTWHGLVSLSAWWTMDGGLWHCTGDRNQDHPQDKEMQKSKMAVWGGLQIAVKRREAKSKGEKERYKHLNAEFQRIARRDKKAFFSDQSKEIEENNRMGD